MKKIFLLLNLIAFTAISQVTPVGGYLPLNSSKSFTAGNATFSNVIARGTLSVGSTATVTGGLKVTGASTIGLGQNNYLGSIVSSQFESTGNGYVGSKLRVGSNVTPTATLDVTGDMKVSSTFSLGSANLTGGNTGTVAVLSDVAYCIQSSHRDYDPGDAFTIYFANCGNLGLTTNATNNRIYVPKNCTLIGYDITCYIAGTAASAESSTLSVRVDNTTDFLLNSTVTYSATFQQWHSMALSNDINAGSYLNIKWQTPTWVTNPTSLVNSIVLWFKLR